MLRVQKAVGTLPAFYSLRTDSRQDAGNLWTTVYYLFSMPAENCIFVLLASFYALNLHSVGNSNEGKLYQRVAYDCGEKHP